MAPSLFNNLFETIKTVRAYGEKNMHVRLSGGMSSTGNVFSMIGPRTKNYQYVSEGKKYVGERVVT